MSNLLVVFQCRNDADRSICSEIEAGIASHPGTNLLSRDAAQPEAVPGIRGLSEPVVSENDLRDADALVLVCPTQRGGPTDRISNFLDLLSNLVATDGADTFASKAAFVYDLTASEKSQAHGSDAVSSGTDIFASTLLKLGFTLPGCFNVGRPQAWATACASLAAAVVPALCAAQEALHPALGTPPSSPSPAASGSKKSRDSGGVALELEADPHDSPADVVLAGSEPRPDDRQQGPVLRRAWVTRESPPRVPPPIVHGEWPPASPFHYPPPPPAGEHAYYAPPPTIVPPGVALGRSKHPAAGSPIKVMLSESAAEVQVRSSSPVRCSSPAHHIDCVGGSASRTVGRLGAGGEWPIERTSGVGSGRSPDPGFLFANGLHMASPSPEALHEFLRSGRAEEHVPPSSSLRPSDFLTARLPPGGMGLPVVPVSYGYEGTRGCMHTPQPLPAMKADSAHLVRATSPMRAVASSQQQHSTERLPSSDTSGDHAEAWIERTMQRLKGNGSNAPNSTELRESAAFQAIAASYPLALSPRKSSAPEAAAAQSAPRPTTSPPKVAPGLWPGQTAASAAVGINPRPPGEGNQTTTTPVQLPPQGQAVLPEFTPTPLRESPFPSSSGVGALTATALQSMIGSKSGTETPRVSSGNIGDRDYLGHTALARNVRLAGTSAAPPSTPTPASDTGIPNLHAASSPLSQALYITRHQLPDLIRRSTGMGMQNL